VHLRGLKLGRTGTFLVTLAAGVTARRSGFRGVRVYFFFISVIFSFAEPEWLRVFSPLDRQHLGFGDSVEQEKVN